MHEASWHQSPVHTFPPSLSQVAAELVATERDILRLRAKGGDEKLLAAREAMRAESASALERKMAAMQVWEERVAGYRRAWREAEGGVSGVGRSEGS